MRKYLILFPLLLGVFGCAAIWGQLPVIIKEELYNNSRRINYRVLEYTIHVGADGLIEKINTVQRYPPNRSFEALIRRNGNILTWTDSSDDSVMEYYTLIIKTASFTIARKRVYSSFIPQMDYYVRRVSIAETSGLLWEDETIQAVLENDVYKELSKHDAPLFSSPPELYTVSGNTISLNQGGNVSSLCQAALEEDGYRASLSGESAIADWKELGWTTMKNWRGLQSKDTLVRVINYHILRSIVRTPLYMLALLGIPGGTEITTE